MVVADQYNITVNNIINVELPKDIKLNFVHYDIKAKKKEEGSNYPFGFLKLAEQALQKIGFFHIETLK
jgi:hypothetical protein